MFLNFNFILKFLWES